MNTTRHEHGNKGKFRPSKNSPHFYGIVRSETEQRELEAEERELKNCAIVRRACDAFFERRGLDINNPIEPPPWSDTLIEACFERNLTLATA
jgi:transposase-like protein